MKFELAVAICLVVQACLGAASTERRLVRLQDELEDELRGLEAAVFQRRARDVAAERSSGDIDALVQASIASLRKKITDVQERIDCDRINDLGQETKGVIARLFDSQVDAIRYILGSLGASPNLNDASKSSIDSLKTQFESYVSQVNNCLHSAAPSA